MGERWDTHQEDYLRGLYERHGVPILSLHPPLRRGAWGLGPEETLVRVARLASRMEVPGKGRLPLKPFPAALGASGYTDALSLELKPWQLGTPDPEAILERMHAARQFTRDGLDAI